MSFKQSNITQMTQEEKELLLKDLGARLPYGVNIQIYCDETGYFDETVWSVDNDGPFHVNDWSIENIKPYLRPMYPMAEDENSELLQLMGNGTDIQRIDFYLSHHFDYRGLIEKGLALEAPEGMYNI
jgi:hypothetical protein